MIKAYATHDKKYLIIAYTILTLHHFIDACGLNFKTIDTNKMFLCHIVAIFQQYNASVMKV